MEEVTINITEEVEEVTINVFEGGTIDLDDTVTDASQNAVKSSGIWAWAKGLFTPKDPEETEADTLTDESVFQFWKGELKKITWANIKDTLKAYFDTIYSTFSGSYNDLSDKPTIPSNAAQITVSDPVTPDFTPAVQGNNLQQVTNKVAGLQENVIVDEVITEPVLEFDYSGFSLPRGKGLHIIIYVPSYVDELGGMVNGRIIFTVNGIRAAGQYRTRTVSLQYFSPQASAYSSTQGEFTLYNQGKVLGFSGFDRVIGSSHELYSHETFFEVENISSLQIANELAGMFNVGTRILITRI